MTQINDQIVEIRYRPNAKVLDYRGAWADAISEIMELSEWRIDENRIDVYDSDRSHHAFVSFRNAGFATRNAHTVNYFADKANKFLRILFDLEGFPKEPFVERLGVRSRYCQEFKGSFSDLVKKYCTRMIQIPAESLKALDADVIDVGSPLTLKDKLGNINFMGGPMEQGQIKEFFGHEEGLPSVGLVSDIDYWLKPNGKMKEPDIAKMIKDFSEASGKRFQRICDLVVGEQQ